jgi:D-sedoheptulose 7-phosphate isomerase
MMNKILDTLIVRYPLLYASRNEIASAFELLRQSYQQGGKLLLCGNGGSAADAEHIVGELMKSFSKERKLDESIKNCLVASSKKFGPRLAQCLQPGLPAISLTCHSALNTAFANDVDPDLIFAQQVLGYGKKGDVLMGISTSGNSKNVLNAMVTARSLGLPVLGLSGRKGGGFNDYCDIVIRVDAEITPEVQELHLPVYHALCEMLEQHFF